MSEKNWEGVALALGGKNGELKSELRTALSALADLRELTKASTPHTTEAGSPATDWPWLQVRKGPGGRSVPGRGPANGR